MTQEEAQNTILNRNFDLPAYILQQIEKNNIIMNPYHQHIIKILNQLKFKINIIKSLILCFLFDISSFTTFDEKEYGECNNNEIKTFYNKFEINMKIILKMEELFPLKKHYIFIENIKNFLSFFFDSKWHMDYKLKNKIDITDDSKNFILNSFKLMIENKITNLYLTINIPNISEIINESPCNTICNHFRKYYSNFISIINGHLTIIFRDQDNLIFNEYKISTYLEKHRDDLDGIPFYKILYSTQQISQQQLKI